jgi:membrane protein YqaA with SNARE-associated domain
VILSVLDSSYLVIPLGNDMLLIALVAHHRAWYPIYVAAAALGSAAGVLLMDPISRKGGEEGLRKLMKPALFDRVKKKLNERAAVALIVACLAPPPFPFVPVVSAASALQYPRKRLLSIVLAGRLVRFSLVGLAALWLGNQITRIIKSDAFVWFMVGFIVLCIAASAYAVVSRVQASRRDLKRSQRGGGGSRRGANTETATPPQGR